VNPKPLKRSSSVPVAAVIACVILSTTGCVKRNLVITSQPTGALVYLNDEEVGRTPVDVAFTYYGVYDIRFELSGYEPLSTTADTRNPIWEYPGPDLIAEALPSVQSEIRWHYALQPSPALDETLAEEETQRLKYAARSLRDLVVAEDTPSN